MFKEFQKTNIGKICLAVIIAGIILRVLIYSYNRPLWNDECALAFNVIDSHILNWFLPLNYGQAAPPFFLVISGMFSKLIPHIELALRFFPLISSILSIFVFYDLSKHILNKKCSIFLALVLFCFNFRLIYYAQEFKQYSSDVLVFLSILASYFYLKIEESNAKSLLGIGIAYAASIWVSFTSMFAIFTIFMVLLGRNAKCYKKLIILAIPVVLSFLCFYLTQHHLATSAFLHSYWKSGFINKDFDNFIPIIINYFSYSFNSSIIFQFFLIGFILNLINIKKEKSLITLVPIFLAITFSYFSIYPLESRVALYLIPICILITIQILEYLNFRNKMVNYFLYSFIIIIISIPVLINSTYKILYKDFEIEDIVTPLTTASKMITSNDILYIPDGSDISYNFYKHNFNFKNVLIEKQKVANIVDSKKYLKTLDKLPRNRTYYYIYSHFPTKKERLEYIYLWARNKTNFKMFTDKYYNALIIFTK